ncbi:MAG TPA: hypothetical protein VG890_00630 [Puia sp.]|nr:hypothetical protein [Puia sp.]
MDKKLKKKYNADITIDPNMRDYSKDPFFVKKAAEAEATLKKYGLPKEFTERRKAKASKSNKTST